MLSPFSHRQLPRYVFARKFAHLGAKITARLSVSELTRLCGLLADSDAEAVVELAFSTDHQQNSQLTGSAKANLPLICQRCLTAFDLPIECQLKLMMVDTEQQAAKLSGFWEPVFIHDEQIDLYQLIEDELLLALPIVAYHQQDCIAPSLLSYGSHLADNTGGGNNGSNNKAQKDEIENNIQSASSFEVLKGLKISN